jgi:hypothetical protein
MVFIPAPTIKSTLVNMLQSDLSVALFRFRYFPVVTLRQYNSVSRLHFLVCETGSRKYTVEIVLDFLVIRLQTVLADRTENSNTKCP